jgi:VanZ family protein
MMSSPGRSHVKCDRSNELKALKQFAVYWLPPFAWMGLIYGLSSMSSLPELPDTVSWYEAVDRAIMKSAHMFVYGVLAWLYLRALRHHLGHTSVLRVVSIVAAMGYGLTDEYHQTFVPGREGKLFDVGVDTVGACAVMVVDWWLARRRLCWEQVPPVEESPAQ